MKKILVVLLGFVLFFGGCEEKNNNEGIKTVNIGALLALTGSAAQWGKNCQEGIELAVNELNDKNKKIKFRISYQDTKADPKTAISAFHRLRNEGVKFIIGDVSSSVNLSIAPLADKYKIIIISPAATSPKLTYAGEYTFRTWNSDAEEAKTMAKFCKTKNIKNITLFLIKNDYGVGIEESFKKYIVGSNIVIDDTIYFEPGTIDFKSYLIKIKPRTQALYIVGYPNELHALFKGIQELNIEKILLGTSVFDDPILKGLKIKNQVYYTYPEENNSTAHKEFTQKFIKKYHKKPGIAADTAYDAMMVINEVVSKNEKNYLKAMYKIKNFQGASGIISFDKYGDVHKPVTVLEF